MGTIFLVAKTLVEEVSDNVPILLGVLQMVQQSILPSVTDKGECCKMLKWEGFHLYGGLIFARTKSIYGEASPVS